MSEIINNDNGFRRNYGGFETIEEQKKLQAELEAFEKAEKEAALLNSKEVKDNN